VIRPPCGLVLITGGIRSGKSRFAERLADQCGARVLYLATAAASDPEMRQRIAEHRARRPPAWETLEEPVGRARAVAARSPRPDVVLVEDLGLLVSNVMEHQAISVGEPTASTEGCWELIAGELDALVAEQRRSGSAWIIVSNEVGLGLVPLSAAGRQFADLLGRANQRLARHADRAYFIASGFAIDLGEIGRRVD
jgi:adenosyl cobinamide kinase/adenosyl cobinamide phosphate guanylyltransferase